MASKKKPKKVPEKDFIDEIKDAVTAAAPSLIGSMIAGKLTGQKSPPIVVFMTQEDFERAVRRIVRAELDT